ncbi:hypothetical protein UY3_00988 [Chelonia mydas]|uniref:Uncharacterized protein n=1 Tax=Chelonia mydas TaxID=8469 RepID=M7CKW9_CHEMY|nr:hypothetical protein UY3_00988 [Chelonia mydas]
MVFPGELPDLPCACYIEELPDLPCTRSPGQLPDLLLAHYPEEPMGLDPPGEHCRDPGPGPTVLVPVTARAAEGDSGDQTNSPKSTVCSKPV